MTDRTVAEIRADIMTFDPSSDRDLLVLIREIDRLAQVTATCTCQTGPDYNGPDVACPVHGAVRALNELLSERGVLSDDAKTRAQRLVTTEAEAVGLRAQVAHLTERLTDSEYDRDNAEIALREFVDQYPRRSYVPGDAEPDEYVTALVSIHDGTILWRDKTGYRERWRSLTHSHSQVMDWRGVEDHMPVLDVTGSGVSRLIETIRKERADAKEIQSGLWQLEHAAREAARFARWTPNEEQETTSRGVDQAKAVYQLVASVLMGISCVARRATEIKA